MISKFEPNKALSLLCIGVLILSILGMLATIPISSGGVAGTITVSSDRFYGAEIAAESSTDPEADPGEALLQITVSDPDIAGSDASMPSVKAKVGASVYTLKLYQISGGSWVCWIRDDSSDVMPKNFPSQDPTVVGLEPDLDANDDGIVDQNQDMVVNEIPLDKGDTLDIVYSDADPVKDVTVTVTYDETDAVVTLDRSQYPKDGVVYVEINDPDLNFDPTATETASIAGNTDVVTWESTTDPGPRGISADLKETGPTTAVFTTKFVMSDFDEEWFDSIKVKYLKDPETITKSADVIPHTGSLELNKSEYTISDKAEITLVDPDLNLDSKEKDEYKYDVNPLVKVASEKDNKVFGVTITETGLNTGVFTGKFKFTFDATGVEDDQPKIPVSKGPQKVNVTYVDPRTTTAENVPITKKADFKTFTGTISLDKYEYSPGQTGTITLVDPDLNLDPTSTDRISSEGNVGDPGSVDIYSPVDGTYYRVLLLETGPDTGEFTGNFKLVTGSGSPGDIPKVGVSKDNNKFKARYHDALNADGKTKTYETDEATCKATTGSITLDQTSYSPGAESDSIRYSATDPPGMGEKIKITVVDPDLNKNPLDYDDIPKESVTIEEVEEGIFSANIGDIFDETGPNTGEFTGTFQLPANVTLGHRIKVTYHDEFDEDMVSKDISVRARIRTHTGTISIDRTEVPIYGEIKVTVSDPDWNLDPGKTEKILEGTFKQKGGVDYWSTSRTKGVQIELTETGKDTGVFEATIKVGEDYLSYVDGDVKRGDTIYFRYNDDMDAGGAPVSSVVSATVTATTGSISLDKSEYPVGATITVTIVDPDMNVDPDGIDKIESDRVWITTTSETTPVYPDEVKETDVDTGIFQVKFVVGGPNKDIEAKLGDGVTVTYKDEATADGRTDVVFTATATIKQYTGKVYFDKDTYLLNETAIITVEDPDQNIYVNELDDLKVSVWSTTDPAGVSLTLIETDVNTGVFQGELYFTEGSSIGSKLQVTKGDIITVKYTDETADPADIPGWTPGVDTILTIKDTAKIGVPYIEKPIAAGTPVLKDPTTGETITEGKAGEQVMLSTEMSNTATEDQPMLYIVQVKDETGRVVYLSFISGTVPAGETYEFGIGWTPTVAGTYTVEVFAWVSWAEPTPLSDVATATITIVE